MIQNEEQKDRLKKTLTNLYRECKELFSLSGANITSLITLINRLVYLAETDTGITMIELSTYS